MLQKPNTALSCRPSDLRLIGGKRVIGAENVAGAVDEKDVIAFLHRRCGGRGGSGSLRLLCGGHDAR